MVDPVAASGLLTAASVMIVALSFMFDRIEVPREKRAKRYLFGLMTIGYLSALGCLYTVTLPNGPLSDLMPSEMLFIVATTSMVVFILTMTVALFPEEVSALFK